jgi:hypothetical protein
MAKFPLQITDSSWACAIRIGAEIEAADNGLLAPELASGITRGQGRPSWQLAHRQAAADATEYA